MQGGIPDGLRLIETARREADGRVALWPLHRARLMRSADVLGWRLDLDAVEDAVAVLPSGAVQRLRLTAAPGVIEAVAPALPPTPERWRVAVLPGRLDSGDAWLRLKSTRRARHDAARAALPEGVDEGLWLNEDGAVCEGTITNIFLRRGDVLLTPPVRCGLLPGVLRQSLLDAGRAVEAVLNPADLTPGAVFVGNALRGLIPADLV